MLLVFCFCLLCLFFSKSLSQLHVIIIIKRLVMVHATTQISQSAFSFMSPVSLFSQCLPRPSPCSLGKGCVSHLFLPCLCVRGVALPVRWCLHTCIIEKWQIKREPSLTMYHAVQKKTVTVARLCQMLPMFDPRLN